MIPTMSRMIPPTIAITVPPTPLTSLVAVFPSPEEDGIGAGGGAGAGAGAGVGELDPNKLNALPIYV